MILDRIFQISKTNSNVKREITAGITTFLAMAYIAIVNPLILGSAGMDSEAVFVATILIAAFSSIFMGLYANVPIALAPAMGINAWFTYGIVMGMGYSWQVALGGVFISGILMVVFTLLPIRKAMINILPSSLKLAIAAGIGLFIAMIGLQSSGLIVKNDATLVSLGNLSSPACYLTLFGLAIIMLFEFLKVKGSVIISILAVSVIAYFMGLSEFSGFMATPPSLAPTFMELDLKGALGLGLITIVLSIFIIDFFDSTATFISVMGTVKQALPEEKLKKALLVDGISTSIGSMLGVSAVTAYLESAVGVVQGGGRTGLVSVTVGFLFLCLLFFSPLLTMIPLFATAPAMIYIACMMFKNLRLIDWDDMSELLPVFLTIISIPLTFSIFNGIGIGIISWIILKIIHRKWKLEYSPLLLIAAAFITYLSM